MTKKQPHERTARTVARTVDITELEPRLCFSQTPAGVAVPEPVWNGSPDLICTPNACDAVGIVELDKPHDWQFCAQHRLQQELVVIDSAVDDRERIIAEFASQADANPVSIFILDGTRDGVEQITDVLAHFDRVSAIHLFSHGAAGRIQLGNAQLSADSLAGYAAQLTSWQVSRCRRQRDSNRIPTDQAALQHLRASRRPRRSWKTRNRPGCRSSQRGQECLPGEHEP